MLSLWPLQAQETAESRAFKAAVTAFQDGIFERAEREFDEFVRKYPQSARVPEAQLFQARAAIKQQKLDAAVDSLTVTIVRAGPLADQYRYWIAEAQMQKGNFATAAASFTQLIRDYPSSGRLLEASYGEALARFKMKDWRRVSELLQPPGGTFQKEARLRPNDELVMRGQLLLAEALLEQGAFRPAEQVLNSVAEHDLTPEFKWRRQYLLCQCQAADVRLQEALTSTTNLLVLAQASGQKSFLAESFAMQGGILERLNDFAAAVQVYTNNLAETVPADRRRQALLKTIELTLAQDKLGDAVQMLESFSAANPDDDLALLTLGELHFKQFMAGADTNRTDAAIGTGLASTNQLQTALAEFEKVIRTFTNSPFVGKAQLNKGWCLWLDGRISESEPAFQAAVEALPPSEDRAVARFKLGDAQFHQKNFTNALQNYRRLTNDLAALPRSRDALFDQALYQMLRVCLEVKDQAGASNAMQQIVRSYPSGFYADRSLLLVGQDLALAGQPEGARAVFEKFVELFPDSPLRPEVDLAVARSYMRERQWEPALLKCEEWLERFATNSLRPQAEFDYAWANYQADRETNALTLFTNFVARFPTDALAPLAQYLVADHYYRAGDFPNAEKNYQILYQNTNWPAALLSRQAQMMAGRSAIARQGYKDAEKYFKTLVNDNSCPPDLAVEAWFALGDTFTWQDVDPGKPTQRFSDAIVAFSKIPLLYPTNSRVALAWGRVGDCYLQMAAVDGKFYDNASDSYQKALTNALADARTRSRAEVGLALVLEKQALGRTGTDSTNLVKSAFDHYYNVVSEKNLVNLEEPDAYWLKEAGFAAARLAEDQKQWEVAINIYQRLLTRLPALRALCDKRIEKAREQLRPEKS